MVWCWIRFFSLGRERTKVFLKWTNRSVRVFFSKVGGGQKSPRMTDVHSDEKKACVSIGRNLQQRLKRKSILRVSPRTFRGGTALMWRWSRKPGGCGIGSLAEPGGLWMTKAECSAEKPDLCFYLFWKHLRTPLTSICRVFTLKPLCRRYSE